MNIFYVDSDPVKTAKSLCDKHVVKMILESAQLLSNAHHLRISLTDKDRIYKLTHKNHPCTLWTISSIHHYEWLYEHVIALSEEYTTRYKKIHLTTKTFPYLAIPPLLSNNPFLEPPKCMPEEFKEDSVVQSYRNYYNYGKRKSIKCNWSYSTPPDWWLSEITN